MGGPKSGDGEVVVDEFGVLLHRSIHRAVLGVQFLGPVLAQRQAVLARHGLTNVDLCTFVAEAADDIEQVSTVLIVEVRHDPRQDDEVERPIGESAVGDVGRRHGDDADSALVVTSGELFVGQLDESSAEIDTCVTRDPRGEMFTPAPDPTPDVEHTGAGPARPQKGANLLDLGLITRLREVGASVLVHRDRPSIELCRTRCTTIEERTGRAVVQGCDVVDNPRVPPGFRHGGHIGHSTYELSGPKHRWMGHLAQLNQPGADVVPMDLLECAVLIPTYNRRNTILSCLEHLAAQDVGAHRLQVIVVDDGSTDDTVSTLEAANYPFGGFTVLTQRNAGPGAARNAGLSHVRAPFTLFINDDTLLSPGAIRAHLDTHHDHPMSMVLGSFVFIEEFLATPLGRLLTEVPVLFSYPLFDDGDELAAMLVATCNLSVPTEPAQRAGFDSRFTFAAEDVDFGVRLEAEGYVLRYCEGAAARHDHHLTIDGLKRTARLRGLGAARLALKCQTHDALLSDVRAAVNDHAELTRLFDEAADELEHLLADLGAAEPIPEPGYAAVSQIFKLGNMLGYLDEPTLVTLASERSLTLR